MKLDDWLPMYEAICREFGFSVESDRACAELLSNLLGNKGATNLENARKAIPQTVLLCGGSAELEQELASVGTSGFVVAADGATSVLADADIRVDMIVTDLDGIIEDQVEASSRGAFVFLHAHGDNRLAVEKWTKKFLGPVIGTCQCPPPKGLYNFGGFTDGDRAACICAELGVRTARLVGFDFDNPAEKRGKNGEVKKRKLRWAQTILDRLRADGVQLVSALDE